MKPQRSIGALLFAIVSYACAGPAKLTADLAAPPAAKQPVEVTAPRLVVYKSTSTRVLNLHVFSPDKDDFKGARPAVLFFHGGGWAEGTPERFYDQARHLAVLGMVAISVDYRIRSVDGTDPKTALTDASSAMRFVRANADKLGIDSARIAAGGGSAGGQLAAALATTEGFDDPLDNLGVSKRPAALVLFNPVIDNGPNGYGYKQVLDYWEEFSPIHNIGPGHPPTTILLGTEDRLIPVETGEAYCDKVRQVGSECQLHLYKGQPHAFFNRRRSKLFYRKTLEAMDGFLRSMDYID